MAGRLWGEGEIKAREAPLRTAHHTKSSQRGVPIFINASVPLALAEDHWMAHQVSEREMVMVLMLVDDDR
jgi:hypothetical protein